MKLEISHDLKLPIEAVTQTFAILAKRGVGKTYAGAVMVEEMLAAEQQVVVADPVGVWWGLRSSADGKSPGFPIVVFGGEHGDVPLEEHAGEIVAQSIIENGFSAVLDLSLFRKGQQVRFMTAFAETLYRLNRKPVHFMVDEADEFAPQRPMHGTERLLGAFEDIVRRGRARGIGVTLITQRAAVLNKNVLTQIEVLVVLRTISPQDREAISAWTEVHGTKAQLKELAESVASLPIGTAWFWSPGWLDVFKKIQVRKKTTFDSSATPKVGEKVQRPKALAEVNLEQLGAQIKATAEKAKENEPAALKRRIAELEKEINAKPQRRDAEIIKEVPVLSKTERSRLDKLVSDIAKFSAWIENTSGDLRELITATGQLKPEIQFFKNLLAVGLTATPLQRPAENHFVRRVAPKVESRSNVSSNGSLSRCERAILTALAQYPQGRSAVQVAILTGYSSGSGGFNNSLSKLRSSDYISRGNPIEITEAGKKALGEWSPLPTGEALASHWLNRLARCESSILSELMKVYPNTLTAQEVAERANYQVSSGGFNKSLSRLRTLELITRGQPMKASDDFFQ